MRCPYDRNLLYARSEKKMGPGQGQSNGCIHVLKCLKCGYTHPVTHIRNYTPGKWKRNKAKRDHATI